MQVEQNNKTLYHIQSVDCCDSPYNTFVFSEEAPTIEQCKKLYAESAVDDIEMEHFVDNLKINLVYADEI